MKPEALHEQRLKRTYNALSYGKKLVKVLIPCLVARTPCPHASEKIKTY